METLAVGLLRLEKLVELHRSRLPVLFNSHFTEIRTPLSPYDEIHGNSLDGDRWQFFFSSRRIAG